MPNEAASRTVGLCAMQQCALQVQLDLVPVPEQAAVHSGPWQAGRHAAWSEGATGCSPLKLVAGESVLQSCAAPRLAHRIGAAGVSLWRAWPEKGVCHNSANGTPHWAGMRSGQGLICWSQQDGDQGHAWSTGSADVCSGSCGYEGCETGGTSTAGEQQSDVQPKHW